MRYKTCVLMIYSHKVTDEMHGRAVMIYSPLGLMMYGGKE